METPHDSFTLTINRSFAEKPMEVWRAWSDRDTIARWWGPAETEVLMAKHDFRKGGEWRYIMPMPDGSEFVLEGVYEAITEGHHILTSANFKPMTEGVKMEIRLEATEEGTHMIFSVHYTSETQRARQERMGFFGGWGSAFDRLEEVVAKTVR